MKKLSICLLLVGMLIFIFGAAGGGGPPYLDPTSEQRVQESSDHARFLLLSKVGGGISAVGLALGALSVFRRRQVERNKSAED
jgi:hypothetical protein